jgi:hypothetical protein
VFEAVVMVARDMALYQADLDAARAAKWQERRREEDTSAAIRRRDSFVVGIALRAAPTATGHQGTLAASMPHDYE